MKVMAENLIYVTALPSTEHQVKKITGYHLPLNLLASKPDVGCGFFIQVKH